MIDLIRAIAQLSVEGDFAIETLRTPVKDLKSLCLNQLNIKKKRERKKDLPPRTLVGAVRCLGKFREPGNRKQIQIRQAEPSSCCRGWKITEQQWDLYLFRTEEDAGMRKLLTMNYFRQIMKVFHCPKIRVANK